MLTDNYMKKSPSTFVLSAVAAGSPCALWVADALFDIQKDLGWLVAVSAAAATATILLIRERKRNTRYAYHEGYADGYLRGVSDRIGEGLQH